MKTSNKIARYVGITLFAVSIAICSLGSSASAISPNNASSASEQLAVSLYGVDSAGNDCDWDSGGDCTHPWDADDNQAGSCTSDASGYSWFACSINKKLSGAALALFNNVEKYLSTDPAIFENTALKEGWKTIRNLSNLIVVIMLVVTIMSQVSGVGISNYGVKKALPRILVVALVINLSFVICRIAIDVMNISGEAIKSTFEPLIASARAKVSFDPGTVFSQFMGATSNGILTVALAYFGTKSFLASGESITLLALSLLIPVALGFIVLVITIFVRGALVVLLTMTAPMAVLLAIFPGTKKTFDKWFNMFKGVLICYPMAALMVYGGNFAGTIAMAALGLNKITLLGVEIPVNVFTLIVSVAATVMPMFMLPKLIIQSTGAIGATLQGFANRVSGMVNNKINNSAFGKKHQRSAQDRRDQLIAGVDKNGNQTKLGRLTRSRSAEERMDAESRLAGSRARRRSEENALEESDTELQEAASKEQFDELEAGGQDTGENPFIEKTLNDVLDGAMSNNMDINTIVGRIDGSMKHFSRVNPKNGAEEILMRKLDAMKAGASTPEEQARAQQIVQTISKSRMMNPGVKNKDFVSYSAYKSMAENYDPSKSFLDGNGHVSESFITEAINSRDFTAEALPNYAKPSLQALGGYLASDTNEGDPDVVKAKQKFRSVYEQMLQTSSYRQNAASADFEDCGIAPAIRRGKGS